jgi:hypothetical protein
LKNTYNPSIHKTRKPQASFTPLPTLIGTNSSVCTEGLAVASDQIKIKKARTTKIKKERYR